MLYCACSLSSLAYTQTHTHARTQTHATHTHINRLLGTGPILLPRDLASQLWIYVYACALPGHYNISDSLSQQNHNNDCCSSCCFVLFFSPERFSSQRMYVYGKQIVIFVNGRQNHSISVRRLGTCILFLFSTCSSAKKIKHTT